MSLDVIAALRERHRPRPFGLDTRCWECNRPYPCPTVKILDGAEPMGRPSQLRGPEKGHADG